MKNFKLETIVLEAEDGKFITNLSNTIFSKKIYLGKYDSKDNYYEISEEEYYEKYYKDDSDIKPNI